MSVSNRTRNGLRNGAFGLFFFLACLALSFFSNRAFIMRLGSEILGMNTTVLSILEMLNIAELGVGAALASLLYKPLAESDHQTVVELSALQGWIYRRVAVFIVVGAGAAMLFFPLVFAGEEIPLAYAYATCIVVLGGSLSSYLINYREVILEADQRKSDIVLSYRLPQIFCLTLQILAIEFTDHGYVWWLVIQMANYVGATLLLRQRIFRRYPYVGRMRVDDPASLRHKYPEVFRRIRQVFAHRMAFVVLSRVSPLVVYAYTSLSMVAAYTNYMIIYSALTSLTSAVVDGFQGSVGNLVASDDKARCRQTFDEMQAALCLAAAVGSFGFYMFADAFVAQWVGRDMVIGGPAVLLLSIMTYISISRRAVDHFIQAHGYFDDVWAALAETGLNVGLSILLGRLWGISGVLTGVVTSLVIIVLLWKPYYLMRVKGAGGLGRYWRSWTLYLIEALATGWLVCSVCRDVAPAGSLPMPELFLRMAWQTSIYGLILLTLLLLTSRGMRAAARRVARLLTRRA